MRYAVRTAAGIYTGVLYETLTPAIEAHHAQYGEALVLTPGIVNHGTLDAPDWQSIAVTGDSVNLERTRRIVAGADFTVSGHATVIALQGRLEDQQALLGLALGAQLRLVAGDSTTLTTFRDRGNTDHDLTPAQVIELWQLGAAWITAMFEASWVLKAQEPIPDDFANDAHWPAAAASNPQT